MRAIHSAILSALAVLATPAFGQDRSADWVRRPTPDDLMTVWPRKALNDGIGGRAVLLCIVTVQGTLRGCRVESEAPTAVGFGGAAMALASQFLLKPAMKGGIAVESPVRIPINFPKPDRSLGSFIAPHTDQNNFKNNRVYSRLPFREAPSYADVLAAYPAKAKAAKVGGIVSLNCRIGEGGRLGSCEVLNEEPFGRGFASAARSLAGKFVVPAATQAGESMVDSRTLLRISFAAESVEEGGQMIGHPRWTALPRANDMAALMPPAAKQAGVLQARVVMQCTVSATGALDGCSSLSQDPPGYGYDRAALQLARYFRLAIWTEEGLPTIGGVVRVPVRFDMAGVGAPKPQP